MFTINIRKEVDELAEQVYQQTGQKLEDPIIALMEWAMKMGIIKVGISLVNFIDTGNMEPQEVNFEDTASEKEE